MTSVQPDDINRLVNALGKQLSEREKKVIKCCLLKKYISWFSNSKIASFVGFNNRWAVQYALDQDYLKLKTIIEDFETLIETR